MNRIESWRIRTARYRLELHKNGSGFLLGDRKIREDQFNPEFLKKIKRRNEIKVTT